MSADKTDDLTACTSEHLLGLTLSLEHAEVLAKVLIQFDTHIDRSTLDFEFDHDYWHELAIDLLKAKALDDARHTPVPGARHLQAVTPA